MGIDCELKRIFDFSYYVEFENGLIENEYDSVFIGKFDEDPVVNSDEAEDWKWTNVKDLKEDIKEHPEKYSYWFKMVAERVVDCFDIKNNTHSRLK